MARWLVDTNLVLRSIRPGTTHFAQARLALDELVARADDACVTPQVVVEFWGVATRPVEMNGLGWDSETVDRETDRILSQFALPPDTADVFRLWLRLVRTHETKGKQVHDARLVAVMLAHGVDHLLTFNVDDFRRYQEIKAVHPRDVK